MIIEWGDLSLCCSASRICYTKSGFSFALNNLLPEVHISANECFCVKHTCVLTQAMIPTISRYCRVAYDVAAEHYINITLPS